MSEIPEKTLEEHLDQLSGLSADERKRCLQWMSRQPEEFQVDLMRQRFALATDMKRDKLHRDYNLIDLAALLRVIKNNGWLAQHKIKSQRVPTQEELDQLEELRKKMTASKSKKHQAPIRQQLARVWGVVVEMRQEGRSYGLIADYLKRAHRITVTRQYLQQLHKKWEEKESK
jgi:hypothetical protein